MRVANKQPHPARIVREACTDEGIENAKGVCETPQGYDRADAARRVGWGGIRRTQRRNVSVAAALSKYRLCLPESCRKCDSLPGAWGIRRTPT